MSNDFDKALAEIWTATIEETNFDMLKNQISFKLKLIPIEGIENYYTLIFKNVSSFFFINKNGKKRFDFYEYEEGSYLELTSINYHENGIGEIIINSQESWVKQYNANTNFSLEIWSSHLFIEAGIVEINGKVYNTKKLNS